MNYYTKTQVDNFMVCANYPEPNTSEVQSYYDFDTESWLECIPYRNLPYNLCAYQIKETENYFVTSKDSYRFKEQIDEREWRDELLNIGKEVDYFYQGSYVKAVVSRLKSDIINGVIVLSPRKNTGTMYCYIYKESSLLQKSCTFTPVITQEELDAEKEREELVLKYHLEFKNRMEEIKKTLPHVCYKKYTHLANKGGMCGRLGVFDFRPYYNKLKISPEITDELLCQNDISIFENKDKVIIASTVLPRKGFDFDVWYGKEEGKIEHKRLTLTSGDAFSDIKIYGATYATFDLGKNNDDNVFEMEFDKEGDIFTLKDSTINNPIFTATMGAHISIKTDGTTYSANKIILNLEHRKTLAFTKNAYVVSWFPSKNTTLFLGHLWQPSFFCNMDEVIEVEFVDEEIKETTGVWQRMV